MEIQKVRVQGQEASQITYLGGLTRARLAIQRAKQKYKVKRLAGSKIQTIRRSAAA